MKEQLTFIIHDENDDYCGMCQSLGPNKYGGPKMHRSLPTQTFNVEGIFKGEPESKWLVLCSDCLKDANQSKTEKVAVQYPDGKEFLKGDRTHFFIRN